MYMTISRQYQSSVFIADNGHISIRYNSTVTVIKSKMYVTVPSIEILIFSRAHI